MFFFLLVCAPGHHHQVLNMFGFICSLLLCVLFVIVFVLGCALPSPVVDRPRREVIGDDVVCRLLLFYLNYQTMLTFVENCTFIVNLD